ncbi:MAG: FHA domain-containing protein [Myxococcaceae bacterium]|nr:FHA domain-containing protein [Myxococcaceae bacterium]
MAEPLARESRPGVMVFAVTGDLGLAGALWLEASEVLRGGCIGRHSCADLCLPYEETLSLRHLLVLTRRDGARTRVRVLDLRSEDGLFDERGERAGELETDGPLVVGAAGWWFFLFPTGEERPWRLDALKPWETLTPRVFSRHDSHASRLELQSCTRRDVTLVGRAAGPVSIAQGSLVEGAELPAGTLQLSCGGGELSVSVGAHALERGVLLGRDTRCDGSSILGDQRISRVHALLVRSPTGRVVLFDLGSTNGTHSNGQERRMLPVDSQSVSLAEVATVRWSPRAQ